MLFSIDLREVFVKITGYSAKELRIIKLEIEKLILDKIKNLDKSEAKSEVFKIKIKKIRQNINWLKFKLSVYYLKEYAIDKIGNPIQIGETGIAEGWNVPM